MGFEWQDIRYGWKALVGIALTGATIYVAASTRRRVTQRDVIEIVLGTYERCLATQYGTSPPVYRVTPPTFVRNWYSNSYETRVVGGVPSVVAVLHTNLVTNAIGWRVDRTMLAACDDTIRALVPWYADPESVGTINPVPLTVTGLWARLAIGDGTNQFTHEGYSERALIADLEERYKVLQALRYFVAYSDGIASNFPAGRVVRLGTFFRNDSSLSRWYEGWNHVTWLVEPPYWPGEPSETDLIPQYLTIGATLWDYARMIGGWWYEFIGADWRQEYLKIVMDWGGYPFAPVVAVSVEVLPVGDTNYHTFNLNGLDTNALATTNWDGAVQTIYVGDTNPIPELAWPPYNPPYPIGWNQNPSYVPPTTYFCGFTFKTRLVVDLQQADTNAPSGTNLVDRCFHYCLKKYW